MAATSEPLIIPPTYVISGANGLYTDGLRQVLQQYVPGSQEIPIDRVNQRVGLMYQVQTGLAYDRRSYSVQCWIKSLLGEGKKVITDKASLFKEMNQIGGGKYLAPTRDIGSVNNVAPGEILIAKPTGNYTGGGRGNRIILSLKDLLETKQDYAKQRVGGIVSTYINQPWLHNGKKMHLRMYFLVRAAAPELGVPYFYELWNQGKINTASLPYIQAKYDDPAIHDSHMKSTDADFSFPEDLQIPDDIVVPGATTAEQRKQIITQMIFEQMVGAMNGVGQIMQSHSNILSESRFGYEVFGIDFMIATENGQPRVYLLECNTRVAYGPVKGEKDYIKATTGIDFTPEKGPWTEKYQLFSRQYFEWMFVHGIAPFYLAVAQRQTTLPMPKKTFLVSGGTGLKHDYLRGILLANGFNELTTIGPVGYLHLEKLCDDLASYDQRVVNLHCDLKSILSDKKRVIANKELLHLTMFKEYPEIAAAGLAPTWKVKDVPSSEKNKIMILRPIGEGASCGRGIYMSSNPIEFEQAHRNILTEGKDIRLKSVIASEYIMNPLLLGEKKFHIRMFFLVRTGPDFPEPFRWDLWPRGRIVTAKLPYQNGDWHNKEIHDTHSESTPYNMWYPEDLPDPSQSSEIYQKMKLTLSAVADIMYRNRVGPYPESRNAFEVFGCDFLITSDYKVILIEINDRVGYRNISEPIFHGAPYTLTPFSQHWYPDGKYTFDNFSQDYFTWLFYFVFKPLFMPTEPATINHLCGFGINKQLLDPLYESTIPEIKPTSTTNLRYSFATPDDKVYLQTFIDQIKVSPKTIESMLAISPRSIQSYMQNKFPHPETTWPQVMKELVSILITEALSYVPTEAVTSYAIMMSFDTLYGNKDKKIVPALTRPTQFVETVKSILTPTPSININVFFGHWNLDLLEKIIDLRYAVWSASGVPMKNNTRDSWKDEQDIYSIHIAVEYGGQLVAATRLGLFANWEEIPGSWWFDNLTEPVQGPVLTISRLVVSSTIQKQGLGKYLDTVAINTGSLLGCKSIFCDVPPYRVEPLKRMGFRQIREPKYSRNFPTLTWTAMIYTI